MKKFWEGVKSILRKWMGVDTDEQLLWMLVSKIFDEQVINEVIAIIKQVATDTHLTGSEKKDLVIEHLKNAEGLLKENIEKVGWSAIGRGIDLLVNLMKVQSQLPDHMFERARANETKA